MSKFIINANVPDIVRAEIGPYLADHEWMVPAWCQKVYVQWRGGSDDGAALETCVNFEYRFVEFGIYSGWLEQAPQIKRDNVIHELLHMHINPIYDYANNTIGMLLRDDESFKAHAQEALRKILEGAVQDLTSTIFQRIAA